MRNRSLETSCWPITRYRSSHVDEMFTPWYCSTNGSRSKNSNEIICKHRKLRLQEHEKVFRESGPSIFLCNKLWRRYIALLLWFYQSVHMTSHFDLVQVQDRDYTVMSIFVKLDRYVDYAEKLNCFDFKGQGHNEEIWYRITGNFCGCLIFAEFCGSIEIAEIKNRKIFQCWYNDEIVSESDCSEACMVWCTQHHGQLRSFTCRAYSDTGTEASDHQRVYTWWGIPVYCILYIMYLKSWHCQHKLNRKHYI